MNGRGNGRAGGGPRPIGEFMPQILERIEPHSKGGESMPPTTQRHPKGQSAHPLRESGFTPIPRVLDDFIVRLGKNPDGRHCSRTLQLVVMDIARYTDNEHHDAVVTNQGIADRRGVGSAPVKASLRMLLRLKILRKEEPTTVRRQELKQIPGGFSSKRRYLVWNPQSRWSLPEDEVLIDRLVKEWNSYVQTTDKAVRVYGS